MGRVFVIKSDGTREEFKDKKIIVSLLNSKLPVEKAKEVTKELKQKIHKSITTEDVRKRTFSILCKSSLPHAQLYQLKDALAKLPPKCFERYVLKLLETDGYICEWEKIIQGDATTHEVDVSAKKDEDWFLVECKRRSNYTKPSGLGKILQVRARFEDIADGFKNKKTKYNFTRGWVINNAKFSAHAKEYAQGKSIWLTGWNYPKNLGINNWIESLEIYPVTIFNCQKKIVDRLFQNDILTFQDFEKNMEKKARSLLGNKMYSTLKQQIDDIRQC